MFPLVANGCAGCSVPAGTEVLRNLVDNALHYNAEGGTVWIGGSAAALSTMVCRKGCSGIFSCSIVVGALIARDFMWPAAICETS